MQLAAQVQTFLLAGYDTTTNAMSFLLYFLSSHSEAQRKLQQEVDTVLGGRAPTLEDIPKVRVCLPCTADGFVSSFVGCPTECSCRRCAGCCDPGRGQLEQQALGMFCTGQGARLLQRRGTPQGPDKCHRQSAV
jgi:hypothetical protein